MKCEICGKDFENNIALGIHISKTHKIKEYYDNENQKSRLLNILKNEKDKYGKNNF